MKNTETKALKYLLGFSQNSREQCLYEVGWNQVKLYILYDIVIVTVTERRLTVTHGKWADILC